MNALFQADLSFLFEQPSIWLVLVETLIVLTPLAIALSGYAAWRVGDRRGLILMFWVCTYLLWMHWPQPLDPALVLPGRVVSVIGWFWLLGAWTRRVNWHEPLLLASNGLVVAFLLALFLTTAVASIRDIMGWDSPA
ncbi:MAG: hypothetical protein K9G71_08335 [Rhodobacteraceae bacterium]|nr:hypothetical protein [Paracoccaceae bacterium]MCF8514355.1 hypothetical protein [Paracoccaceae bacterium]MCF8518599.1 hypothetical protein [Paracoccaceae bacterium]